ncbi:MAG: COG3014 family protein [Aeromonadaceae bacterium]
MVLSGSLSGCVGMAMSDLFVTYSERMQPVRTQLQLGHWQEALAKIPDSTPTDNNYLLDRLEQGRIAFLGQKWVASQQALDLAAKQQAWLDEQAEYRLSRGLQQAGSLLTNDQAIGYQPPDYEQALLHHYQALNYLFQDKSEDALVEIRKANQVQEQALARRDKELQQAREEAQAQGLGEALSLAERGLPEMTGPEGAFKGKVQSGYTFYLSALLYEATGNLNDAYVDYRRAFELTPDSQVLQKDLLRITARMGLVDQHAAYAKQFAMPAVDLSKGGKAQTGQIVIFQEQGLLTPISEFFLPLPIATSGGDFRTFTIALPYYPGQSANFLPLGVVLDGERQQTQPLMSLHTLAAHSLQERLPALLTRQLLRLAAKERMRREAAKGGGDLGNILVGIYNTLSEHADTRAWSSLPESVGIWRTEVAAGSHALALGAGNPVQLNIPVTAGKITLVWVVQLGANTTAVVKTLQ